MARVSRGIQRMAALDPDVQAGLQRIAEERAAKAAALAAAHSESGTYATSFSVGKGRVDRYVQSNDPAALAKEFGRTGARGKGTSRGIFALIRAMNGEG